MLFFTKKRKNTKHKTIWTQFKQHSFCNIFRIFIGYLIIVCDHHYNFFLFCIAFIFIINDFAIISRIKKIIVELHYILLSNPNLVSFIVIGLRVLYLVSCFLYYNDDFFFLIESNLEGHFNLYEVNIGDSGSSSPNSWIRVVMGENPRPEGGGPSIQSIINHSDNSDDHNSSTPVISHPVNYHNRNPETPTPSLHSRFNLEYSWDYYQNARLTLADKLEQLYNSGKRQYSHTRLNLSEQERLIIQTHYLTNTFTSAQAEKFRLGRFSFTYLSLTHIRELREYNLEN